ncbi:bifunctional metallophosphatase/5'-nucleotidase [Vibrio metschnikovii]|uniref:Bifunctional metallophosphatase/5'-nucleotidase n=1 Tax=bacterium 19MO02SH05 TaxID=2920696 RepID=A0AAU6TGR7_UNCXX|nr:bifunctional metallophosphatase/5'-nucleotidase [Vibrio sp. A8-1]EKO3589674.1 bifunctional metallophosphatase/5'-nucleotidase [Vibrio metschnikovii]EKO3686990.1 bifunctional metallophosphatase/5'-nucleotidase [Vibrio metschnikovii]EKO3690545.1 bifunctional metallophosphatase/5'-nucleotidase [Vibrio metschnikovii]EKO3692590.1 bifunctional metallophosphatase/5'-nucleotidase [Vibrio metschnikovii]EKO3697243.1 bifunctional metallophosphatase/5'-nucleotidase [Vibrio metschnikovii]
MRFNRAILASTIALALLGCSQTDKESAEQAAFELTIAHINDTHSSFDAVRSSFYINQQRVYNEFGGHPRILSKANTYREQAEKNNQSMLFLHGGDAWQGSAYFKLNEGLMNADILSRMGIDAMALGNHEFDLNNQKLNAFLDRINFPVLAANIDASLDKDLKDQTNLKPYVLYAFDGYAKQRFDDMSQLPTDKPLVGVFGLALDDMPNIAPNTGDVQFFDMVESAQATVDELQALGIKNIIAVTHVGNAIDLDIASKVNGIDLIVGGHSHSLLGDFTNLGLGNNGIYAQLVTNPNGTSKTCVVQAGEFAQAIGKTTVAFDSDGELISCAGHNTLLTNDEFYHQANRQQESAFSDDERSKALRFIERQRNIAVAAEEAALRAHIDSQYKPAVEKAYGDVIANVPQEIRHARRPGDNNSDQHGSRVAPIVALGQYYWAASDEVVRLTGMKADFALTGAGGIRTNIAEGEYREGDVTLEMLPFANFMSVLPVKGSVIKALIEKTVSETLPPTAHAGKFPYGGNLRYVFDETVQHQAGTLSLIEVNTGTLNEPIWSPLEDNKIYNVAMNSYNATGNDGWTPLFEAQKEQSGRVDFAYVDGNLTAFPVSHIEEVAGRYQVRYQGHELNCKADNVVCNTDARAVVKYIAEQQPVLEALDYPVVTLNRIN